MTCFTKSCTWTAPPFYLTRIVRYYFPLLFQLAAMQGPCILVQYSAVNIWFLLPVFKDRNWKF
jgi:hypothetical protein